MSELETNEPVSPSRLEGAPAPDPNPYEILGIGPAASRQEIIAAAGKALGTRCYSPRQIAQAQKALMDPRKRLLADLLRPLLPPVRRLKRCDRSAASDTAVALALLPEFDGLDKALQEEAEASRLESDLSEPVPVMLDG